MVGISRRLKRTAPARNTRSKAAMTHTSTESKPQAGDILVHRTTASPGQYVISAIPGSLQAASKTYNQAVASVPGFLTAQRVDVWYTDDDRAFGRVISPSSA